MTVCFDFWILSSPKSPSLGTAYPLGHLRCFILAFWAVTCLDSDLFPLPLKHHVLSINTWQSFSHPAIWYPYLARFGPRFQTSPLSLSKCKLLTASARVLRNPSPWSYFLNLKSHSTSCLPHLLSLAIPSPVTNILSLQQDCKLTLLSICGLNNHIGPNYGGHKTRN